MLLNRFKVYIKIFSVSVFFSSHISALDIEGFSKEGFNKEGFYYSDFKKNEKKCKEMLSEENKELDEIFNKINLKECFIVSSDKKCDEIEKPPVEFLYYDDLMGYNNSDLRCKLFKNNHGDIELSQKLWLIDLYGKKD